MHSVIAHLIYFRELLLIRSQEGTSLFQIFLTEARPSIFKHGTYQVKAKKAATKQRCIWHLKSISH